jgi:inosine-uridine nucleoside N-ribohydrolase
VSRPVILDCDTGTDDAVAIALAALHPDIELLGVTTVWGNHEVAHTTDNTLRVLDHLGFAGVPVHAGLAGPYAGREPPLPGGRADLPPTLDLPTPTRDPDSHDAVGWLVDTVRTAGEAVTLVATGPWSNLAAAVTADPELLGRLDRLVLLGGTRARPGVTRWAERNVWCDPRAADTLIGAARQAGTELLVITMDATFSAPLDSTDVAALDGLGTPAATMTARLLAERIEWYRRDPAMAALGAAPVHDALAVAALIDPAVVTGVPAGLAVVTEPGEQQGRVVCDLTPADGVLTLALAADSPTYRRVLSSALART